MKTKSKDSKIKVLLLITGSIAAVRIPLLVSQLAKENYEIRCVLSKNAEKLIKPLSLSFLSRNPCILEDDQWSNSQSTPLHIELSNWADILIIAPLTATTLAKWVTGNAEGLIPSILIANIKPIIVAPAMNTQMWRNKAVQKNYENLENYENVLSLQPSEGLLACDAIGIGKIPPNDLIQLALEFIASHSQNEYRKDLINKEILDKKLFPMTLGGEHSITPGCIVPFTKKYKNICLLHFDAHADLRQSYNGEKFSHASAIRRCLDYKNVSLISFGIRNISESEIPFLKKNSSRINIFWAKDKKKWNLSKFKKLIKNKTVYLTFDVDGLDSSIMPATGTPEPGGLLWDETLDIIRIAAKNSKIVGADINELSPIKGFNSYNFLVAKLAYKILSYKFLY